MLATTTADSNGVVSLRVVLACGLMVGNDGILLDGVGLDGEVRQASASLTITSSTTSVQETEGRNRVCTEQSQVSHPRAAATVEATHTGFPENAVLSETHQFKTGTRSPRLSRQEPGSHRQLF